MAAALKREPLDELYRRRLAGLIKSAPFVLRITRSREQNGPVLVIKERMAGIGTQFNTEAGDDVVCQLRPAQTARLVDRGHIAGEAQRRLLPILKSMLARVRDDAGVPLHLERWMMAEGLRHIVNLPLEEEAGAKLAIIFQLQQRIANLDRIELIARRAERLTREEALYLLSRMTRFGPAANRWAMAGLRVMLGGQAKDTAVTVMLDWLRGL
jgi:hypothetical protein